MQKIKQNSSSKALPREVVVVSGWRSPLGKAGGVLAGMSAVDLGAAVLRETVQRSPVDADQLDAVIIGNVIQPAEAANIARVLALAAGVPRIVSAHTVHRNCAAGMSAVTAAAGEPPARRATVVLA